MKRYGEGDVLGASLEHFVPVFIPQIFPSGTLIGPTLNQAWAAANGPTKAQLSARPIVRGTPLTSSSGGNRFTPSIVWSSSPSRLSRRQPTFLTFHKRGVDGRR